MRCSNMFFEMCRKAPQRGLLEVHWHWSLDLKEQGDPLGDILLHSGSATRDDKAPHRFHHKIHTLFYITFGTQNLTFGAQKLPKTSQRPPKIMKKVMPERIPVLHRNSDTFLEVFRSSQTLKIELSLTRNTHFQ